MFYKFRFFHKYANIALFIFATLFSLLFGEIVLRILLFSNTSKISLNHHFFANPHVDDNGYRLLLMRELKGKENKPIYPEFDPILGWTAKPRDKDNPLGIVIDRKYKLDEFKNRQILLFFGNSFVEGLNTYEYKLPQLLDKELSEMTVLNFGNNGYGLDQMYLWLRSVIGQFSEPHIMIGLIYPDLDRCIYQVMHAAKPYFKIEEDSLVLKGVPIAANYGQWLEQFPVTIKSYLFAGCDGLTRRAFSTRWGCKYLFKFHASESTTRRNEKEKLWYKLIEEIKELCKNNNASLTFVLFPSDYHMIHEGWQEVFLKKVFYDLKIDYIDLKKPLKDHLETNDLKWYKDLYRLKSHPDDELNQLIATFLANYLTVNYYSSHLPKKRGMYLK